MVYKFVFHDVIWGKVLLTVSEEEFDAFMSKLMEERQVVVENVDGNAIAYLAVL